MSKEQEREALERIAGFTLSQFMGPNDMALECVNVARDALASPAAEPVQALTDERIKKLGETVGSHIEDDCDYSSWGQGYRKDGAGKYSIPCLPANLIPFARAIEAEVRALASPPATKEAKDGSAERAALQTLVSAINFKSAAITSNATVDKVRFADDCVWRAVDDAQRLLADTPEGAA